MQQEEDDNENVVENLDQQTNDIKQRISTLEKQIEEEEVETKQLKVEQDKIRNQDN